VSVVSTRQNNVVNEQGQVRLGLIPVMDLLNHQYGRECIHYDSNLKQIECTTMKEIETNEQIFMFYGKRTNAEYLIHNGFVPDQPNPYDTYLLKLGMMARYSADDRVLCFFLFSSASKNRQSVQRKESTVATLWTRNVNICTCVVNLWSSSV
jgi:hypothetical protein